MHRKTPTLTYIKRSLLIFLMLVILLLIVTTINHQLKLIKERKELKPIGQMVTVNNHQMHVYREGQTLDKPTLVFMAGYSTVAPVYNFKPLYRKYREQYPIAVVEKAGYGYSEQSNSPRDIDTILEESRSALELAGVKGPYILFPHSLSGFEAIYWAEKYPADILGIVGLDMDFPKSYDAAEAMDFTLISRFSWAMNKLKWLGLMRVIPAFKSPDVAIASTIGLSKKDQEEQEKLMHKNAFNQQFVTEGLQVNATIDTLKSGPLPKLPYLFFVSNGAEIGDYWVPTVEKFAEESGAELIYLKSGHFIQNLKPDEIYTQSLPFLDKLTNTPDQNQGVLD